MKKERDKSKVNGSFSLLFSIIVVFCILGAVVFSVSRKISVEMSASAIQNLSESLDLIECTIEAVLNKEAEYQRLMAQEIAQSENPREYICTYQKSQTMVKISLICAGRPRVYPIQENCFLKRIWIFPGEKWWMDWQFLGLIQTIWEHGHTL